MLATAFSWSAFAACPSLENGSAQERKTVARVTAIPEVKAWLALVSTNADAHAAFIPDPVARRAIDGHCYWEIAIYSDEGSHFHLWNTFFVSATGNRLRVADSDGNSLSIKEWRADNQRSSDAKQESPASKFLNR